MKKIRILLPLLLIGCLFLPSRGALLGSPAGYDYTGSFVNGLAAVCREGKWGAVGSTGAVEVPLIYDSLDALPIAKPDPAPQAPPLYSHGLAVTHDYHTNLFGYTDESGRVVIAQIYDYAAPFHNGFARVMRRGLWGFIDRRGCEVIPPIYQYARDFDEVGAWVQTGQGRVLIPLEYARQCAAAFQPDGSLYVYPSSAQLLLGTQSVSLEAYEIGGQNYVRLRDFAALLAGTGKGFAVSWDAGRQIVSVTAGGLYTPVGGELTPRPRDSRLAVFSPASVLWNGREMAICAYEIDGSNFFRLRDLMALLDVAVGWDSDRQQITLDLSQPYDGYGPSEKLPAWRQPYGGFDLARLYDGNPAGPVQCAYSTVEYLSCEMPSGLYGVGVLNPAARYDPARSLPEHLSALDSVVRQAFGLSVERDGTLRDADGGVCFTVLHDGRRLGLKIEAWRDSVTASSDGSRYQNAALEMLQYLSGSDEVGSALWSLIDALQLGLPGSTGDFGFTDYESDGQVHTLIYRSGARIVYDGQAARQITLWFE